MMRAAKQGVDGGAEVMQSPRRRCGSRHRGERQVREPREFFGGACVVEARPYLSGTSVPMLSMPRAMPLQRACGVLLLARRFCGVLVVTGIAPSPKHTQVISAGGFPGLGSGQVPGPAMPEWQSRATITSAPQSRCCARVSQRQAPGTPHAPSVPCNPCAALAGLTREPDGRPGNRLAATPGHGSPSRAPFFSHAVGVGGSSRSASAPLSTRTSPSTSKEEE
jgi:hypothetical protein